MRLLCTISALLAAFSLGLFLAAGTVSAEPRIDRERIPTGLKTEVKVQISRLYSENPRERGLAVRALQGMGDAARPAIPFLASMVGDTGETGLEPGFDGRASCKAGELAAQALLGFGEIGVAPFLDAFDDPSPPARTAAVSAVARLGSPMVPRLVECLSQPSWYVRRCALMALGTIGDSAAVEPVLGALHDEQPEVRFMAARTLGSLGDRRAVEPLIAALWDDSARLGAITALGMLGDPRAAEPLIECLSADAAPGSPTDAAAASRRGTASPVRFEAIQALGRTHAASVLEPLLAALRGSDIQLRQAAARALSQLADPGALAPLVATLDDTDGNMRYQAAEALGSIGGPEAVTALVGALHRAENRDPVLASGAVVALGHVRDPRAMEALAEALKRENLAPGAGPALAAYGAAAVPVLVAALDDPHNQVQMGALAGLAQLGEEAVDALTPLLRHKDSQVRLAAARSLTAVKSPPVDPLIGALKDDVWNIRGLAAAGLGKSRDPRAVDPLIEAMRTFPENTAAEAAEALGAIGDPKAVPALIETLGTKSDAPRRAAAHALGLLKDPRAVKPLLEALRQPEPRDAAGRTHNEIVEALAAIGEPAAGPLMEAVGQGNEEFWSHVGGILARLDHPPIDRLIESLRSSNERVRRAATVVLGHLGERATPSILAMLGDASPAVREAAADALGRTGGTVMLAPLVAALADEDEAVRDSAEGALAPVADQAMPMLLEALRGKAPPETAAAVRLLAAAGPKAVDPLLGMLKDADWQARWVAVQALGRLRDRRAIAPLIEALADPHFYVRKDAGEALEEIAGRRYGADAAQWREWYEKEGRAAPGGVSG